MTSSTRKQARSFVADFVVGFRAYPRVPGVLTRHRLWHYLFVPSIISLLLSLGVLAGIALFAGRVTEWVDGKINFSNAWFDAAANWSVGVLTFVAMAVAFVFVHKHLVLILLAPFLGRLAELTVRGVEQDQFKPRLDFLQSIKRALQINLRLMVFEILWAALYLIIGLAIPFVGSLIAGGLIFLNQSRYSGFGLMDFPLEYHGFDVQRSIDYSKRNRARATGLGAGYLLLMMIPFVGWMFAPTLATVAGAIETMDDLRENSLD